MLPAFEGSTTYFDEFKEYEIPATDIKEHQTSQKAMRLSQNKPKFDGKTTYTTEFTEKDIPEESEQSPIKLYNRPVEKM